MNSFIANLYELWGNLVPTASDKLFDNNIYFNTFWMLLVVTAAVCALYYYALPYKYYGFVYWLMTMLTTALLLFIVTWVYTAGVFQSKDIDLAVGSYLSFLFLDAFYAVLLFFAFSIGMKFGSLKHRTPF